MAAVGTSAVGTSAVVEDCARTVASTTTSAATKDLLPINFTGKEGTADVLWTLMCDTVVPL